MWPIPDLCEKFNLTNALNKDASLAKKDNIKKCNFCKYENKLQLSGQN